MCAGYKRGSITAAVVLVELRDGGLGLHFPKTNPFVPGDDVTIHLDDRTGSEIYSIELKVHRCSYKGRIKTSQGLTAELELVQYELFYGSRIFAAEKVKDYTHDPDTRSVKGLDLTRLENLVLSDDGEKSNKLGVLVTRGVSRPHTTVMAFLNTTQDDIFIITMPNTYKYQNLIRDPRSVFAMDHRGTFNFEKQVEWNYTLYETYARRVEKSSSLFSQVQRDFVEKNPWEAAFFQSPEVEMIHLDPLKIIHQDIL